MFSIVLLFSHAPTVQNNGKYEAGNHEIPKVFVVQVLVVLVLKPCSEIRLF